MTIHTDRITLVFPIAEKNRAAAASMQTLEITESGREFETVVPLDLSALGDYADRFSLGLLTERDSLALQVVDLTAEVARLTALIPPPVDPNAVPATITRTQARLVLHRAGLLEEVLKVIEASGVEAQIWYEAAEWNRASPILAGMAQTLGFSDEQVDNLFRAAGAIIT